MWILCAAAVATSLLYWPTMVSRTGSWLDYLQDDAFYYFVVARNIAEKGVSTFDGSTLTNGYQPLWQLVLSIQQFFWPDTFFATVFFEGAAVWVAAMLALKLISPGDFWCLPLLTALFCSLVHYELILVGMETSILFLAFECFVYCLYLANRNGDSWVPLAIFACAAIAARLDAAFFVIGALLAVPLETRQRIRTLAFIAACGLVYAVGNKLLFDSWLPVSGVVKSLGGGLGLNRALLQRIAGDGGFDGSLVRNAIDYMRTDPGRIVLLLLVTAVLVGVCPRRALFGRRLAVGVAIGCLLYIARLMFLSSWVVGPWYYYPIFILLTADFLLIAEMLGSSSCSLFVRLVVAAAVTVLVGSAATFSAATLLVSAAVLFVIAALPATGVFAVRARQIGTAIVGIGLLAMSVRSTVTVHPGHPAAFGEYGRVLARNVDRLIGGAAVAMGDRAGSFAYFYRGPVHQLEGLVNDARYVELLRKNEPLQPYLCRRGVRYLLGWEEVDLGEQYSHAFHIYRPGFTSFEGPTITVAKADEVAKFTDSLQYSPHIRDRYVYLWRIPGCSPAG